MSVIFGQFGVSESKFQSIKIVSKLAFCDVGPGVISSQMHAVGLSKNSKVCVRANVAHQAGAYPGFCSMKRLGVFLLPPGWDASPSQGYPPALSSPVPIYTPGWREAL